MKVIKFSASWCAPCKALAPNFEKVKALYADRVEFIDIDIDTDEENLVSLYKIRSVPSVVVDGGETNIRMLVGVKPVQEYIDTLNSVLNTANV